MGLIYDRIQENTRLHNFDGFLYGFRDDIKKAVWEHASPCGKCHTGWEKCGCGDKSIFGKVFENLCHSPLMFNDPDAYTLEIVKKLILMLK